MELEIVEEKCIGAGLCVVAAPDLVDQREEDGIAFLVEGAEAGEHPGQAHEAVRICPAAAILLKGES
jgi:ferredoxin